ncbi:hypothetical protein LOK49_LG03G01011 [Camellia lanceoleosa]|uniref:Uncharacterized protein n=1 Tax=Camellia lanceoleosa TaxID=1840588 RepID=A0ACC0ID75_9ERIC|nr:hypothetical protein LOK49_LG03G01011 [Camellia lanceoleosa]
MNEKQRQFPKTRKRSSSKELKSFVPCSLINGGLPLPADLRDDADKAVAVALSSNVEDDKADVGGSLSRVSVVEETMDGANFSNETCVAVEESSLPMESQYQGQCNHALQNGIEATYVSNTQQLVGGTVHGPILSQGLLKSLSQSYIDRPGIHLEIALGQNALGPQIFGPSCSGLKAPSVGPICATSGDAPQAKFGAISSPTISSSNTQRLKKGKRRWSKREGLKHCLLAGKFSGFARRIVQSGATSNKGFVKSFKSGSTATVLHPSTHSPILQPSSNHGLVQEAQSTLQMGQRLGLEFKGHESEVIREIVQMEERDKEQLARGKGKVE